MPLPPHQWPSLSALLPPIAVSSLLKYRLLPLPPHQWPSLSALPPPIAVSSLLPPPSPGSEQLDPRTARTGSEKLSQVRVPSGQAQPRAAQAPPPLAKHLLVLYE